MEQFTLANLANYGALTFIAVAFFRGYWKDKEQAYEFNKKVLEFQERMAVIMADANATIKNNHDIAKGTKDMHDKMDDKIQKIFDEMATAQSQNELIKAVNDLRRAWEALGK